MRNCEYYKWIVALAPTIRNDCEASLRAMVEAAEDDIII